MRQILAFPAFEVRAVRLAKRILAPATGRPREVALKAKQARVPARARLGKIDSLSGRWGVVDVGGLAGAETTVEFMPVPQPLLDGWFAPSPL